MVSNYNNRQKLENKIDSVFQNVIRIFNVKPIYKVCNLCISKNSKYISAVF